MQDQKLYLVVRDDLAPGLAAAQAVHAALAFADCFRTIHGQWMKDSQYVVVLTSPDPEAVYQAHRQHSSVQIAWYEPDMDGQLTAVALGPGFAARRVTANLPLLGRRLAQVV